MCVEEKEGTDILIVTTKLPMNDDLWRTSATLEMVPAAEVMRIHVWIAFFLLRRWTGRHTSLTYPRYFACVVGVAGCKFRSHSGEGQCLDRYMRLKPFAKNDKKDHLNLKGPCKHKHVIDMGEYRSVRPYHKFVREL